MSKHMECSTSFVALPKTHAHVVNWSLSTASYKTPSRRRHFGTARPIGGRPIWQGQLTVSPFHELAISSTCATRLLISHLPEHRLWTRQLVGNRLPVANVAQSNVFVSWHLDARDGEFPMRPKEPALALQRRAFC